MDNTIKLSGWSRGVYNIHRIKISDITDIYCCGIKTYVGTVNKSIRVKQSVEEIENIIKRKEIINE